MTEQEFTTNIKNKTLTEEMIALTAHSYSKRAKNYRTVEYYLKSQENRTEEENEKIKQVVKQKQLLYQHKAVVLTALKPTAIHMENHVQTNDDMLKVLDDKENGSETVLETENFYGHTIRYYLAYKANGFVFHTPIKNYELNKYKYKDLPIINVGNLYSKGEENLENLLPLKYCEMVYELVKNNKFNFKR